MNFLVIHSCSKLCEKFKAGTLDFRSFGDSCSNKDKTRLKI